MDDTKAVNDIVNSLRDSTRDLKSSLDSSILRKSLNELVIDLSDATHSAKSELAKCKLLNAYSFVVASLYFSYLKACGLNTGNDHAIMEELARVKSYIGRVQQAEKGKDIKAEKERKSKEAAKNFIRKQFGGVGGTREDAAISRVQFEGKHTRFAKKTGDKAKSIGESKPVNGKEALEIRHKSRGRRSRHKH